MLDPFSAVSLAGTIVQFVHFGAELLSKIKDVHRSGSTVDCQELDTLACHLKELSKRVKGHDLQGSPQTTLPKNEEELYKIASGCETVADKLTRALGEIASTRFGNTRFKAVRTAFRATWSRKELDKMSKTLQSFQDHLTLHVLVSLRENGTIEAGLRDTRFFELKEGEQNVLQALNAHSIELTSALTTQSDTISYRLDQTDRLSQDHYEQIIIAIKEIQCSSSTGRPRKSLDQTRLLWTDAQAQPAREQVLNRLRYRDMGLRRESIIQAHEQTFSWIFDESDRQRPWDNFVQWLKEDSGCYWINGKAGSGKSTLLKYIVQHPRTAAALKSWSRGQDVLIPSFFFWRSSNSPLECSDIGFWRSILVELLSKHEELIPLACPELYDEELRRSILSSELPVQPPSDQQLKENVLRLLDNISLKICFFIDGLDEFRGDHREMAKLFKAFTQKSNVKMVISSRLNTALLCMLEDCRGLRLQDFTDKDIQEYVRAELESHPAMRNLLHQHRDEARSLVLQVVSKSSGIFWWVKIVVRSLIDGLEIESDRVGDLKRRLELIPSELEGMYKHMLNSMQPIYRRQASRLLQIVLQHVSIEAKNPLSLLQLSFADEENLDVVTALSTTYLTDTEKHSRSKAMYTRLLSRCCGLLEISGIVNPTAIVGFLHETVINFLRRSDIYKFLQELTSETDFDPNVSLLAASLAINILKHKSAWQYPSDTISKDVLVFMNYCRLAEATTGRSNARYLNACDTAMRRTWMNPGNVPHWSTMIARKNGQPAVHTFLGFAAISGLALYIEDSLYINPVHPFVTSSWSWLGYAINAMFRTTNPEISASHFKVVQVLLKRGVDPNQTNMEGLSAWMLAVFHFEETMWRRRQAISPAQEMLTCGLLQLLVEYGANPNAVQERPVYNPVSRMVADKRSAMAILGQYLATQRHVHGKSTTKVGESIACLIKGLEIGGGKSQAWLGEDLVPMPIGSSPVKDKYSQVLPNLLEPLTTAVNFPLGLDRHTRAT